MVGEHAAKVANSESLHTYVVFAGLTYGAGEELMHDLLRSAWHRRPVPLFGTGTRIPGSEPGEQAFGQR